MITTIYNYQQALQEPTTALSKLKTAQLVRNNIGDLIVSRTALFVEFRIVWQGDDYLLCCPLSPVAIPRAEEGCTTLCGITSDTIPSYQILRNELTFTNSVGDKESTDVVLQALPAGEALPQYIKHNTAIPLLESIDKLEATLRELDISHNNIKPENIIVGANLKLYPIRFSYAKRGAGGDTTKFNHLRTLVQNHQHICPEAHCDKADACCTLARKRFPGHIWVGNLFEQLVCVEDITGYGFVDSENRQVIKSKYLWAGDFKEGRAEVETATGMGLIDRLGNTVIPAKYQIVEYDIKSGFSRVKHNEQWALFDYSGEQITPFSPHYIKDGELQQANKHKF